ncbi:hypothetical protein ACA910_000726 [Epithemia clementina (nom. ined.)]
MPRMMIHQQLHDIVAPHDHDVLSGRGNFVNYHAGNEHFRSLVRKHKVAYVACPKQQKGKFSRMIVEEIRARNPPGRFLKQDPVTKLWHDIGEKKALDKTRQALREGAPEIMKEISGDEEWSPNEDGSDEDNSRHSPRPMISGEGTRLSPTSSVLLPSSTHSMSGNKPMFPSGFNSNDLDDGFGDDIAPSSVCSAGFVQSQQSSMQHPTRISNSGIGSDLLGQHSQHSAMGSNHRGAIGQHSQHGGLGQHGQHGGLGQGSQHGGLGQGSQHGGLGQHSQHGGLGQHSQHGAIGQNSQQGGLGRGSQHGGLGRGSQHGGMGQHSQHGGMGQHSQHGGMGQHSQHGGLGQHSQHGGMGQQSLHSNHGQRTQLNNPLGQHSQHGQHSPTEVTSGFGSNQLHPGMNMSDIRQQMQQQQHSHQQQSRLGGSGFSNGFNAGSNISSGGLFQSNHGNHEISLQNKLASLTQMQQAMFAQQQQYQQKQHVDDDDEDDDDFEFEPRPIGPVGDSMPMPLVTSSLTNETVVTNESVGMAPQLRKAPARIPRRGDLEREGSEKSLKMDTVFAKELAGEIKSGQSTNLHGSNGSVMSISLGELGHDIDSKDIEVMPPPKSLTSQELFEGAKNQDELVQMFDSSMRIKQQQKSSGPSRSSGDGSDIARVLDMSVATLGDSGVMYTGDASLGMSFGESFSNVFEEVDKDLYVGSN